MYPIRSIFHYSLSRFFSVLSRLLYPSIDTNVFCFWFHQRIHSSPAVKRANSHVAKSTWWIDRVSITANRFYANAGMENSVLLLPRDTTFITSSGFVRHMFASVCKFPPPPAPTSPFLCFCRLYSVSPRTHAEMPRAKRMQISFGLRPLRLVDG